MARKKVVKKVVEEDKAAPVVEGIIFILALLPNRQFLKFLLERHHALVQVPYLWP